MNPYDKLFAPGKAGEVIVAKVTSVEDGVAHLEDGRDLHYDYLVLATGTFILSHSLYPVAYFWPHRHNLERTSRLPD